MLKRLVGSLFYLLIFVSYVQADFVNYTNKYEIDMDGYDYYAHSSGDNVALSENGKWALLQQAQRVDDNTYFQIFKLNLETGKKTMLPDNTKNNYYSFALVGISNDGNKVVYKRREGSGYGKFYLYDFNKNIEENILLGPNGNLPNRQSYFGSIDGNATQFTVMSFADNWDGDKNEGHFYYRDLEQNKTMIVDRTYNGDEPNRTPGINNLTSWGLKAKIISKQYIAYESSADNIVENDTNNRIDVFIFNTISETTMRMDLSTIEKDFANTDYPAIYQYNNKFIYFAMMDNSNIHGLFIYNIEDKSIEPYGIVPGSYRTRISKDGNRVLYFTNSETDGYVFRLYDKIRDKDILIHKGYYSNSFLDHFNIIGDKVIIFDEKKVVILTPDFDSFPTANAGKDQTVTEGQIVTLNASDSSDTHGEIVSYEWKEGDNILSTDKIFTTSDFTVGVHTIVLTVTNDKGKKATDEVKIIVNKVKDWFVDIKNIYNVYKNQEFNLPFSISLADAYNGLDFDEKAEKSKEELFLDYNPNNISVEVNNSNIKVNCSQVNKDIPALTCKIIGKINFTKDIKITITDNKNNYNENYNVQLKVNKYSIDSIVADDSYIIINSDEITHNASFGFSIKSDDNSTKPKCYITDSNGKDIEIYMQKVKDIPNRYICSTSYYKWYSKDEQFSGDIDQYEAIINDILNKSENSATFDIKISYGDSFKVVKTPIYKRDNNNYQAVLEKYSDYFMDNIYGKTTQRFVVINDKVYNYNEIDDKKFYLGGTNKQGSPNKDFVYLKGGIWKLTTPGHEMIISLNNSFNVSELAFWVDGKKLEENNEIVNFLTDPNSNYNMLLKKTFVLREVLVNTPYSLDTKEAKFTFSDCLKENNLDGIEPGDYYKSYSSNPCYAGSELETENRYRSIATAAVRGTTVQFTKEKNKTVEINLLEGIVDVYSEDYEQPFVLKDMTSYNANEFKSKISSDVLTVQEIDFLNKTSLNATDLNKSIGVIKVNSNLDDAKVYLLGNNVRYSYGKSSIFANTPEGNYTIHFLPLKGYVAPKNYKVTVDKNHLNIDINLDYLVDTDGDGVDDSKDLYPNDPKKWDDKTLTSFIQRIYSSVMGRDADEEGLNYWKSKLESKELSGADIIRAFVESKEFKNKDYDNQDFITALYNLFFGRVPDKEGLNYWLDMLSNNKDTRRGVVNKFIDSNEFKILGTQYNFTTTLGENEFVTNVYIAMFDRAPDLGGLTYWSQELKEKKTTASSLIYSFVKSDEFINREYDNTQYIQALYKLVFSREADEEGLNYWKSKLDNGESKDSVLNAFLNSNEFATLCNKFGIKVF